MSTKGSRWSKKAQGEIKGLQKVLIQPFILKTYILFHTLAIACFTQKSITMHGHQNLVGRGQNSCRM